MSSYEEFKKSVERAAATFRAVDAKEPVRIVSHLDADGISASAILIRSLHRENRNYSISIVQQLTKEFLNEIAKEKYRVFFFTDLGSGNLSHINEALDDREVFILDHHEIEDGTKPGTNVVLVNPHLQGIDGSREISGAGVVYRFSKALSAKNRDMAHIALLGAVGDIQEDDGFLPLNKEILEEAQEQKTIKVIKGLRLFGAQTKPLHKLLEYSTDPYIPGVSGSESGAIQFLNQIGINPKQNGSWKRLVDLSDEDLKKLVAGIVMMRISESKPEDVLGWVYILPNEEEGNPTRDAREFATLLNACGRMNKASLGIGACLGDPVIKQKAINHLNTYRKEIVSALSWYNENKNSDDVLRDEQYVIINAKDNVRSSLIGTLASILAKGGDINPGTYVMSLAYMDDAIKVSLRVAGIRPQQDVDLKGLIARMTEKVGGEAGGHTHAAGAMIPREKEEEFLDAAKEILSQVKVEERVV